MVENTATETEAMSIHDIVNVGLTVKELQTVWDLILKNGYLLNDDLQRWKPINRKISGALNRFAKSIGYSEYRKLREENDF